MTDTGWDNPTTARMYSEFCAKHGMYSQTSADLVGLAEVSDDETVVDLACGTGQTTQAILERLGPDGRIHAVDRSEAMLEVARAAVTDPRVEWHVAPAEEVHSVAGGADAVVCNSAIWQTDMVTTFGSVRAALRPGGRFACNIGRQFILMPLTEEELHPVAPTLHDLMLAIAILDFDYVPFGPGGGRPLTVEGVAGLLQGAGLDVRATPEFRYESSLERDRDWLRIPIFTEHRYAGLTYTQRMQALDAAYARVKHQVPVSRWAAFLAVRPAEGAADQSAAISDAGSGRA